MPNDGTAICILSSISILSLPARLDGQAARYPNPALQQGTVDAAALGPAGRGFFEYLLADDVDWIASGGVALGGGMLRGSYGKSQVRRIYGLGYARRIAEKNLGLFGTWGTGVDLAAAYDDTKWWGYNSRAVRLAIPLSLRWGSPSRLSLSPYVTPYAEWGRAAFLHGGCAPTCPPSSLRTDATYSTGLGAGFQLTAWRLSLEVGMMGAPTHLNHYNSFIASGGLRWRF